MILPMTPQFLAISADSLAIALKAYPHLGEFRGIVRNGLSVNTAACIFQTETGRYFAKRYDPAKRDAAGLAVEHRITRTLLAKGYPTPRLHLNQQGEPLTWEAGQPYAVFDLARGEDRYGRESVFAPFRTLDEARSAGYWLARFHLALADFPLPPPKPFQGITARYQWLLAPSIQAGLQDLLDEAPELGPFLDSRPEFPALLDYLETRRVRLAPYVAALPMGVTHGDFIKRNLFFEGNAVSEVIDFDLWNVGPWVFDLSLSLLPCGFDWSTLRVEDRPRFPELQAFLQGYEEGRPLGQDENMVLSTFMETARFEIYLSIIAMSLRQDESEKSLMFWKFITRMMNWFTANENWSLSMQRK